MQTAAEVKRQKIVLGRYSVNDVWFECGVDMVTASDCQLQQQSCLSDACLLVYCVVSKWMERCKSARWRQGAAATAINKQRSVRATGGCLQYCFPVAIRQLRWWTREASAPWQTCKKSRDFVAGCSWINGARYT